MTAAQQKEGLDDWGPLPFAEPLQVLTDSYACAPLNDIGVHILRSGLIHSLRMRLRAQEWIRRAMIHICQGDQLVKLADDLKINRNQYERLTQGVGELKTIKSADKLFN